MNNPTTEINILKAGLYSDKLKSLMNIKKEIQPTTEPQVPNKKKKLKHKLTPSNKGDLTPLQKNLIQIFNNNIDMADIILSILIIKNGNDKKAKGKTLEDLETKLKNMSDTTNITQGQDNKLIYDKIRKISANIIIYSHKQQNTNNILEQEHFTLKDLLEFLDIYIKEKQQGTQTETILESQVITENIHSNLEVQHKPVKQSKSDEQIDDKKLLFKTHMYNQDSYSIYYKSINNDDIIGANGYETIPHIYNDKSFNYLIYKNNEDILMRPIKKYYTLKDILKYIYKSYDDIIIVSKYNTLSETNNILYQYKDYNKINLIFIYNNNIINDIINIILIDAEINNRYNQIISLEEYNNIKYDIINIV